MAKSGFVNSPYWTIDDETFGAGRSVEKASPGSNVAAHALQGAASGAERDDTSEQRNAYMDGFKLADYNMVGDEQDAAPPEEGEEAASAVAEADDNYWQVTLGLAVGCSAKIT